MKAYIQCNFKNMPFNETVFSAYKGFEDMGIETVMFTCPEDLQHADKKDICVGGLGMVKWRLESLNCPYPELDYPEELASFLGRKIWTTKINTINAHPELWPVFVKPYVDKLFTGRLIQSPQDLVGCGSCYEDYDVICSTPVNFMSEWRVFVKYGEIIDVRPYKGDWKSHYNPNVIENCLKEYKTQPASFAMDFGVSDKGNTLLVEINDGFSVGSYGLFPVKYAQLLSARWAELTNTVDECDFNNQQILWRKNHDK